MKNKDLQWAVIFDVDGTMVDNLSAHRESWVQFCARYDIELTDSLYREKVHAKTNDIIIANLFGDGLSQDRVFNLSEEKEEIYRAMYQTRLSEIPGLQKVVRELHEQKIPMVIASNAPEENVTMVVDGLQLRDYFQFILTEKDAARGKPAPDLFLLAAEKLGLPPANCLVIEDSVSGFLAAEQAGMPYIVITHGAEKEGLKQAKRAVGFYGDFTEIDLLNLNHYLSLRDK